MICPNKICKQEIPDDSLYCDQCGLKILRCSKCGAPGIGKHCGKCGGALVFSETQMPAGGEAATTRAPEPQPVTAACACAPNTSGFFGHNRGAGGAKKTALLPPRRLEHGNGKRRHFGTYHRQSC